MKRALGVFLLAAINLTFLLLIIFIGYFGFAIIVTDFDLQRALFVVKGVDKEVALKVIVLTLVVLLLNDPVLRFLVKVKNPIRWNLSVTILATLLFIPFYLSFRNSFLEYHRQQTPYLHAKALNKTKQPPKHKVDLPDTKNPLVILTTEVEHSKWDHLKQAIGKTYAFGFHAYVDFSENEQFVGIIPEDFQGFKEKAYKHSFVFLADEETISNPEHPIICVDLYDEPGKYFRVIPSEMWAIENNLTISNVSFDEFYGACDEDGVYRGN